MPKDHSIQSVLVIGSGPIVIGQACEFDYSGTQAVKVLKQEGIRVSLVNSNPATIMTDPEYADRTYVEPLTPEAVETVLESGADRDPESLLRAAVRANVRASANQLRHGSVLLERLIREAGLVVVGAEYSLETGLVEFFDGVPGDQCFRR